MKGKGLVILSGGQDSTTCLFWAKRSFKEVSAITFDYRQRHLAEIDSAKKVAEMAGVTDHEIVALGPILTGSSPLVSANELEQYADHASLPGGLEKTFVPGRNLLFLVVAANRAYTKGITDLVTGVSSEDYGGYPDCRPSFIQAAARALRVGLAYEDSDPFNDLVIHAPLIQKSKADTVRMASYMPDCWEALAYTTTAYDGAYPPLGHDHATLLRAKGFEEAGLPDPLIVRAWREGHLLRLPHTANYKGKV